MIVIKYEIKNTAPLVIKDSGTGSLNQMETIGYIAGSTVRGFVINMLDKKYFNENKKEILSDKVRFLNAYPCINGYNSIPSPKIYYARKITPDNLSSILDNEKLGDEKRASIGNFCAIVNDEIFPINVKRDEAMSNTSDEQEGKKLFRSSYICENQTFYGYIEIDNNEELADKIVKILKGENIYLGGFLSHGFGKCECISANKIDKTPYSEYKINESNKTMKMLLLSDTVMVNKFGEPCGIDEEYLMNKLGNFKIANSSTSVVNVYGRNRTIGGNIPTDIMYEKGSVFMLEFDNAPDIESIRELENKGIGKRRNEGYGQIIFTYLPSKATKKEIDDEENISFKEEKIYSEEEDMLKELALNYYKLIIKKAAEKKVIEEKGRLSNSQMGVILSLVSVLKSVPEKAEDEFKKFFEGKDKKRESISTKYSRIKTHIMYELFGKSINEFLGIDKEKIFGFKTKDLLNRNEEILIKLDFLETEIRYIFKN